MPKLTKQRTFELTEVQRRAAERELQVYVDALCHDPQYAIRRACWLIEVLQLPVRITRQAQLEELNTRLAVHREGLQANPARKWIGRPWTLAQLRRSFYARAGSFRRPVPHPVTRAELAEWTPNLPPIEVERRKKAARKAR